MLDALPVFAQTNDSTAPQQIGLTDSDLFILFIYLIIVALVFTWMQNSLNDVFEIKEDSAQSPSTQEQMDSQDLTGQVELKFDFDNRYEFDKLESIPVEISNQSGQPIYVDWDKCSVTDFGGGRSRRVIRITPGLTLDLLQSQAPSVIAPGRTLKEKFTAEDVLKRESDAGALTSPALINIKKLKDGKPKDKQTYRDFTDGLIDLKIFVKLALRVFGNTNDPSGYRPVALDYQLALKKLPWTAGLPWNPKK